MDAELRAHWRSARCLVALPSGLVRASLEHTARAEAHGDSRHAQGSLGGDRYALDWRCAHGPIDARLSKPLLGWNPHRCGFGRLDPVCVARTAGSRQRHPQGNSGCGGSGWHPHGAGHPRVAVATKPGALGRFSARTIGAQRRNAVRDDDRIMYMFRVRSSCTRATAAAALVRSARWVESKRFSPETGDLVEWGEVVLLADGISTQLQVHRALGAE